MNLNGHKENSKLINPKLVLETNNVESKINVIKNNVVELEKTIRRRVRYFKNFILQMSDSAGLGILTFFGGGYGTHVRL